MPAGGDGAARGRAVVALDVGGTGLKGAVVAHDGTVLATEVRPTDRDRGPDDVVRRVVDFAADLHATAQERTGAPPLAAGLAVLGLVDEARGVAVYSANIGWRDVPLGELVAERLGVPVALGHDIRVPAVAEGLFGSGRGVPDFLLLPVGTGIAAAVVIGGRPYGGAAGFAGELGHVAAFPDGEPCACGQRGCVETYASAAAIPRRYAAARGESTGLSTVHTERAGAAGPLVSTAQVIARAKGGDPVAARVWGEALDALAIAIAGYTLLLDPTLVVMGGGLAEAGDALLVPLRERVAARLAFRDPPEITRSLLGTAAGTLGAAVLAWRTAGDPDAGANWTAPSR